jgi:hypothetical protein
VEISPEIPATAMPIIPVLLKTLKGINYPIGSPKKNGCRILCIRILSIPPWTSLQETSKVPGKKHHNYPDFP